MDTSIGIRALIVTLLVSLICISGALAIVPVSGRGYGGFPFPETQLPDIDFSVFQDWEPVHTSSHFIDYSPPHIGISEIPEYKVPEIGISFSDYQFPAIDISYCDYKPPAVSISYFDFRFPTIGISEIPHRN